MKCMHIFRCDVDNGWTYMGTGSVFLDTYIYCSAVKEQKKGYPVSGLPGMAFLRGHFLYCMFVVENTSHSSELAKTTIIVSCPGAN